jgi:EAL domain-containing protein (putative c-di-GMP-specific phosphodiesterase class I)/CheY-like chemotaxis protein
MCKIANKSVLIVDDEAELTGLIAELADAEGLSPQQLNDSTQFEQVYQEHFDLIFIDLMMPGKDGVQLLRHLGEKSSKVPIVIMSGFDNGILSVAYELAKEHRLNIIETVAKPFRVQQIKKLLKTVNRPKALQRKAADIQPLTLSVDTMLGAIKNNQFCFHYQPQVNLADNSLYGYEALARWHHPEHGVVKPAHFITFLEKNSLISTLSLALLHASLKEIASLPGADNTKFSINVSTDQLSELDLPDYIHSNLIANNINPERLTIEITETGLIRDNKSTLDILARFRLKGFNLAIDDFGTGSAMYEHLQKLPINELKIDKSFISRCLIDMKSKVIVEHTVSLAKQLGIRTVAEGVESGEIASYLKDVGVDIAQGYYFGKPKSYADTLATSKINHAL